MVRPSSIPHLLGALSTRDANGLSRSELSNCKQFVEICEATTTGKFCTCYDVRLPISQLYYFSLLFRLKWTLITNTYPICIALQEWGEVLRVLEAWSIRQVHMENIVTIRSLLVRTTMMENHSLKRHRMLSPHVSTVLFSQPGKSQLISTKKIRHTPISSTGTALVSINLTKLFRFPIQGLGYVRFDPSSSSGWSGYKPWLKTCLSWFVRLSLAWSSPGFGGSWNVQLTNQKSTSTFRHPAGIVVQTSSREAQVLRQQK